jgi:hypothetical protein
MQQEDQDFVRQNRRHSSVFLAITQGSPLKANRRFRTYLRHHKSTWSSVLTATFFTLISCLTNSWILKMEAMSLRSVGLFSMEYMALYHIREKSSLQLPWESRIPQNRRNVTVPLVVELLAHRLIEPKYVRTKTPKSNHQFTAVWLRRNIV